MKKMLMLGAVMAAVVAFGDDPLPEGGPYKETVEGIEWTFMVDANLNASVGAGSGRAVPSSTKGAITIPVALGGRTVTSIGDYAFAYCSGLTSVSFSKGLRCIGEYAFEECRNLTSVSIPSSVTSVAVTAFCYCSINTFSVDNDNPNYKEVNGLLLSKDGSTLVAGVNGNVIIPDSITMISKYAFNGRRGLKSVVVPSSVTTIGDWAFSGCTGLTSVTIPSSVTSIGVAAFASCSGLRILEFEGDAPATGDEVFFAASADMIIKIKEGTSGWMQWNGRKLVYEGGGGGTTAVTMTVTNVVIHYIQTSELSPMAAPITPDVGIVNVMTEIEGGIVAVPESWATNYPSFKQKFGDDFAVALTRETGKFDANRKPMYVWQDYVAGTDPTNVEDQFRASVTMVGGKPVISFTPVLSEKEAAKRVYTTYGKVKLQDEQWEVIEMGEEEDYNFFKVTVKMK